MQPVTEINTQHENPSGTVPPVAETSPPKVDTPVPANGPGGETVYIPLGRRSAFELDVGCEM